jgi:solute carrier family 1 (neuronal/epithelial high affinity glutamate transporter), member 1
MTEPDSGNDRPTPPSLRAGAPGGAGGDAQTVVFTGALGSSGGTVKGPTAADQGARTPDSAAPRRFGDYELLGEIARGGMGVVYRARQVGLNRIVALKMIKAGEFAGPIEIQRFQLEAQAAANLQHPHIVTIYEVGERDGQHFFSMDYIEGPSLTQLIRERSITPEKGAEYLQAIAEAIDYAHQQGILHRDLKPSNIMIDVGDHPRLTDFGLAKRLGSQSRMTQSGSVLGTPPYMSPEQASGRGDKVGRASDIYSLGAILYDVLTGRPPFQADTPLETLWQVMETEPPLPRTINPAVPQPLETICLKCLAKNPHDRYATAGQLAEELGRYLRGEPILARPIRAAEPSPRLTWYMIGAIVAAIGLAAIAPNVAAGLHLGGEVFLGLLKMIVVPLVMAGVISGVVGMGDVRKLGRPGLATAVCFLTMTIVAVAIGMAAANLLQPGIGITLPTDKWSDALPAAPASAGEIAQQLVHALFNDNLFGAMVNGHLLPVIVFSLLFAGMLTTMGRRAEPVAKLVSAIDSALLGLVMLLMRLSPIGVFCLVAARFGQATAAGAFQQELLMLVEFCLTVIGGLAVYLLVVLPLVLLLIARRDPYRFARALIDALLTAFSTASSVATLPITLECAEKKARVERRAAEFVLPLATTIKKDGTALFVAVAVLFIAQAYGRNLDVAGQLTVLFTAVLASLGTAGVPSAGLVTMLVVLNAVGIPAEGAALVLSIDWLLDRFRTAVNVASDAVAAAVVERSTPAAIKP